MRYQPDMSDKADTYAMFPDDRGFNPSEYETCARDQHEYEWMVPYDYLKEGALVARCRKCGAELVAVRASRG